MRKKPEQIVRVDPVAAAVIPTHTPWIMARWAFRMLIARGIEHLDDDSAAREALESAAHMEGIHFDPLEPAIASRIAHAMWRATEQLRSELLDRHDDRRGSEFAEILAEIGMHLQDIHRKSEL